MNDKIVIAVLCFGSHICNQAARIRVYSAFDLNMEVTRIILLSFLDNK
jgi:hypothetical protein